MYSSLLPGLVITIAIGWRVIPAARAQEHGPVFLMEPPPRLVFSNSTGARVSCAAHGFPPPRLAWQLADGSPADDVPGLREVQENGTLVLHAFSAAQYRQDVHAAVYRCRAHNSHGAIVSRDMRTQAVVWQEWSVAASTSGRAETGGPALLNCAVPSSVREHANVAAWYRDDAVLLPNTDDLSGVHVLCDEGWRLVVREVRAEDARAQFSCSVLDTLSGDRKRSPSVQIDVIPSNGGSPPRTLTHGTWEVSVKRGADALLPCLVHASPPPAITWYREGTGGTLREVRREAGGEAGTRLARARSGDVLAVRRADVSDAGRWACRAANALGHVTLYVQLAVHAPLTVHVQPQLQVVNSGSTASVNCSWGGWPAARLEWLHNGAALGGVGSATGRVRLLDGGARLVVASVYRGDRGVYQCVARNDRDSAQASAELRLGDTAPELHYTFIEQALRPGQLVTLKCSALGSPPPHFTWLLDGQPLNAIARGHRYSIEQFSTKNNDVVGFLNISSVRSEDGGLYTCRASNSLGEVSHTSRLNIYGPPYVRSVGPIRAVANRELTMYCPYAGYPISSVRWERDGGVLLTDTAGGGGGAGPGGALHVPRVEAAHAGSYTCTVTGPRGEIARRDIQLVVSNPPEIEPFSFSASLQEGRRAQVSCSVTSGDMPVYFSWYKDNAPIPASLQVEERGAEFFSNLVFKEVSSRHSGLYTCVASNSAAKVNYTTELVVKVSPKWVTEPSDASILVGEALALHCQTKGSPNPQITWLKLRAGSSGDFIPLVNLGGRFQFLGNGSLWIESALPYDEGQYMCRAENGVGSALTKTVFVSVNEPARFELTSRNVTARRETPATLLCDVTGDHPIQVQWTHNMNRLDLNTYRLSISEAKTDSGLRSQLYISRTDRQDSGVYKCQAVNAYGHNDHYIYLSVQEKPDAPHSLAVIEIASRAVRLTWVQGFDGNSPLLGYTLQYDVLNAQGTLRAAHWDAAVAVNVSTHTAHGVSGVSGASVASAAAATHIALIMKGDHHYEALLGNLRPHTAYMIRLAALNQLDRSAFTEPVVVKTQEEAPSESPLNVHLTAGGPGELHVTWRAPPRDSWHGELLGYTVSWTEITPGGAALTNSTRTLTVNGWSASELSLAGLRKFTRYEVRVRAFNGVAAGPPSAPVAATTLEGVPESHPQRLQCAPLTSVSIKVSWVPPPVGQHGGLIQGYKVIYTPLTTDHADIGEVKRTTTTETYLHALHKYTNYSIQVLAFTNAGDGRKSPPVYCMTEEDVPSAPQKIKALALSHDAVLVSWLPPLHPNGVISHYTVYHREAGRIGKHLSLTTSAERGGGGGGGAESELMLEVRHLAEQLYEFWVSATSGPGEGEPTSVVAQSPSSRVPARIASFGGAVVRGAGGSVLLACTCVGVPSPRSRWLHAHAPVTHHKHYQVTPRGHLHIKDVNEHSSGNFTCSATNTYGEDSITYTVVAILPPAPPALSLQYTTASTIKLHWQAPRSGGSAILGYSLHYKDERETDWHVVDLAPDVSSYVMDMLKCGSKYLIKIQARNKIATGAMSEILTASTRGAPPKAPKSEELINTNATAIKINFYSWRDGGCPIAGFRVEYRRADDERWLAAGDALAAAAHVLGDLAPAAWYELRVAAYNDAGLTEIKLYADTLKLDGGRIGPFEPSSPLAGGGGGARRSSLSTVVLSCAASALLIVATVAAVLCLMHGKKRLFCLTNQYVREDRKFSESNDAEREKLREGQKLYSSSSINGHEKTNDDSSELYEISPYATFGVAESGAGGGGALGGAGAGAASSVAHAHSLHFRTFGRHDDDAPPPRRHRRDHRDHHRDHRAHAACDHYGYDESSLSKSSTVEARHRMRAGCAGAGWREPPTDSDDNSDSAANTTTKGSGGSPGTNSAYGSGRRSAARGSSRLSHYAVPSTCLSGALSTGEYLPPPAASAAAAPTAAPPDISSLIDKFQQRKEQERRECTIHV